MEAQDNNPLTRRQMVGGMTAGLAAAVTPAAFAQATGNQSTTGGQAQPLAIKRDPTTQYPRPPFPRQRSPSREKGRTWRSTIYRRRSRTHAR